ncbi:MAG: tRNA-dihydrouridine synthase family protein [Deltaproteobacteria bacterium]|nr:tRNA-dihydrouridine synthase family protein [Deltaproteobacteria bacterium]
MAGLTHIALRQVIDSFGPGRALLWTGMCGANALPSTRPALSTSFSWRPEELPHLCCQILGSEPEAMARAAIRVQDEGFFGVDVNMGCSVSQVCRFGAGAALLRDPNRALAIVEAIRRAVSIPLFVKFRTGWTDDPIPAVDLARRLEDAGVDALVFHPRIAPDRRTRPPRWAHISLVRRAVSIPVIGNGNVFSAEDCLRMMDETGCHGVSLGRLAVARPWTFALWLDGANPGPNPWLTSTLALLDALAEHFGEKDAVRIYLGHLPYIAANFVFGHSMLSRLRKGHTVDELRTAAHLVLDPAPEVSLRPSTFLFTI